MHPAAVWCTDPHHQCEFRELCEHAEDDIAALRTSVPANRRAVVKQIEWDLKEAAVQAVPTRCAQ